MTSPLQPEKEDKKENISPDDTFYGRPKPVLLDARQWRYIQRRYHISPRELEVLSLIAEGYSNQEIGLRLHISLSTVKGHTTQIYGKLNANNRTQAVARARVLGLIPFV